MAEYAQLRDAIVSGDATEAVRQVEVALKRGAAPLDLVREGLQSSMIVVGEKFSTGEFFVPEMLFAAEAVKEALEVLRPSLASIEEYRLGKIVVGTVAGDIHDIGKNLVSMLLEGAGFEVIDLGTDVSSERFVEAVRSQQPAILAMSALLTTTMPGIRSTIEGLESVGIREQVKVVVGGAPVTEHFAEQVGADGYAPDAGAAVLLCRTLLELAEED